MRTNAEVGVLGQMLNWIRARMNLKSKENVGGSVSCTAARGSSLSESHRRRCASTTAKSVTSHSHLGRMAAPDESIKRTTGSRFSLRFRLSVQTLRVLLARMTLERLLLRGHD